MFKVAFIQCVITPCCVRWCSCTGHKQATSHFSEQGLLPSSFSRPCVLRTSSRMRMTAQDAGSDLGLLAWGVKQGCTWDAEGLKLHCYSASRYSFFPGFEFSVAATGCQWREWTLEVEGKSAAAYWLHCQGLMEHLGGGKWSELGYLSLENMTNLGKANHFIK